jgi:hypothetical protein
MALSNVEKSKNFAKFCEIREVLFFTKKIDFAYIFAKFAVFLYHYTSYFCERNRKKSAKFFCKNTMQNTSLGKNVCNKLVKKSYIVYLINWAGKKSTKYISSNGEANLKAQTSRQDFFQTVYILYAFGWLF